MYLFKLIPIQLSGVSWSSESRIFTFILEAVSKNYNSSEAYNFPVPVISKNWSRSAMSYTPFGDIGRVGMTLKHNSFVVCH